MSITRFYPEDLPKLELVAYYKHFKQEIKLLKQQLKTKQLEIRSLKWANKAKDIEIKRLTKERKGQIREESEYQKLLARNEKLKSKLRYTGVNREVTQQSNEYKKKYHNVMKEYRALESQYVDLECKYNRIIK